MPNTKLQSDITTCAHPLTLKKHGRPMPISKEACNRCNDAWVLKTGYCCEYINCRTVCNRYGNPDLCNWARDPSDAHKTDDCETVPLMWDPEYKRKREQASEWEKEPPGVKNARQYGTYKPNIFQAERMNKLLAKEGRI